MLSLSLGHQFIPPDSGGAFQAESNHLDLLLLRNLHNFEKSIDFDFPVEELFYTGVAVEVRDVGFHSVVGVMTGWPFFLLRF